MAERTCAVPGCTNRWRARDWCRKHYTEWLKTGKPGNPSDHRAGRKVCSIPGCERPHAGLTWCSLHLGRYKRNGDPLRLVRRYGEPRIPHGDGYWRVWAPDHPLADSIGYVFEHRKVMWDAGLLTDPKMHVHHINHDKGDNRIENLEVKDARQHARDHAEEDGWVTNQFGTWPVRPREQRASAARERPPLRCKNCGREIPSTRRRNARHCSDECTRQWGYRREVERQRAA